MTIDTVRVRMAYTTNHAMRHLTEARVTRITMRHSYMQLHGLQSSRVCHGARLARTDLHGYTVQPSMRPIAGACFTDHCVAGTCFGAHICHGTRADCGRAPRSVAAMRASCPHERALPSKSERRPTCARGRCRAPRRPSHPPLRPEPRLLLPNAGDSRKHTRRLQERRMHESCRPAHTCQHEHATSQCVM